MGPRVLSLESVDCFGTSEYFNRRKKQDLCEQNFDGQVNRCGAVVNFHCMSLVVSMSAVYFRR